MINFTLCLKLVPLLIILQFLQCLLASFWTEPGLVRFLRKDYWQIYSNFTPGLRFLRVLRLMSIPDILQYLNILKLSTSIRWVLFHKELLEPLAEKLCHPRLCQISAMFISVWLAAAGNYFNCLKAFSILCLHIVKIQLSKANHSWIASFDKHIWNLNK